MKKTFWMILMVTAIALSGCMPSLAVSDQEMETMVAQALTSFPTRPPTEIPTALPSNTPFPTATEVDPPTLTPLASATPVEIPTLQPTEMVVVVATNIPTQAVIPTSPTPVYAFTPPPGDPLGYLGAPTSTDPMDKADTWYWPTSNSTFATIEFTNGVMVLKALTTDSGWMLAGAHEMANFYLEMTARLESCSGSDGYGIIFRVPVRNEADRGYLYEMTCDGRFALRSWDGKVEPKGKMTNLIPLTANPAIISGPLQFNRMGVMAIGSNLRLYANGVLVGQITDTTYASGYAGAFINQNNTPDMKMQVDMMSYWKDPAP